MQAPAGARTIDGTGKFLIPGMIDAHVHLATKPDLAKIGQDEHGWGTRPQINQLPDDLLEKIIR